MDTGIIHQVKIIAKKQETEEACTLMLQPLHDWKPHYQAGQFITLVFYNRQGEQRRSYSISSAPGLNEPLSITVKKLDNGEFSRWLVYKAKPGDKINTSGISGFFTLPKINQENTYCFLAAGSGITPCFSLIKTLLHTTNKKVFLIYSNRSEQQTIFLQELTQLQALHQDRFTVQWLFSNRLNVYQSRLSHWLLSHFLNQQFAAIDKNQLLFYLCGPFNYTLMATISLRSNGILNHQIVKEDFHPQRPTRLPQPPDKLPHRVTIHIGKTHHSLEVQYPQNIVSAAKAAHIAVPYSCEAGRCGSCVATCISGQIWMAYNEVLSDEELQNGRVLTCQGFPVGGDAEIVYE